MTLALLRQIVRRMKHQNLLSRLVITREHRVGHTYVNEGYVFVLYITVQTHNPHFDFAAVE